MFLLKRYYFNIFIKSLSYILSYGLTKTAKIKTIKKPQLKKQSKQKLKLRYKIFSARILSNNIIKVIN